MPNEFFPCGDDVTEIAERLIADYHRHLLGVRIEYLFRTEAEKQGGAVVLGSARKIGGLNAFLARATDDEEFVLSSAKGEPGEPFFAISLWKTGWEKLDERQKIALLDHELCHCFVSEGVDGKANTVELSINPHDVEEFRDVVHRHGLWRPDVESFVRIAALDHKEALPWATGSTPVTISAGGRSVSTTAEGLARAAQGAGR